MLNRAPILEIPAELRLMIFEFLYQPAVRGADNWHAYDYSNEEGRYEARISSKALSPLLVCRVFHEECWRLAFANSIHKYAPLNPDPIYGRLQTELSRRASRLPIGKLVRVKRLELPTCLLPHHLHAPGTPGAPVTPRPIVDWDDSEVIASADFYRVGLFNVEQFILRNCNRHHHDLSEFHQAILLMQLCRSSAEIGGRLKSITVVLPELTANEDIRMWHPYYIPRLLGNLMQYGPRQYYSDPDLSQRTLYFVSDWLDKHSVVIRVRLGGQFFDTTVSFRAVIVQDMMGTGLFADLHWIAAPASPDCQSPDCMCASSSASSSNPQPTFRGALTLLATSD